MPPISNEHLTFAGRQRIAVLSTADAEGAPHAVPVCFAVDGLRVYSVVDRKPKSSTDLKRLRNVRENPRAALLVHRYDDDWSRLAWVLLRGAAAVLESGEERERAVELLRDRYPQYRTMDLEGMPVLRLTVDRTTGWGALE